MSPFLCTTHLLADIFLSMVEEGEVIQFEEGFAIGGGARQGTDRFFSRRD